MNQESCRGFAYILYFIYYTEEVKYCSAITNIRRDFRMAHLERSDFGEFAPATAAEKLVATASCDGRTTKNKHEIIKLHYQFQATNFIFLQYQFFWFPDVPEMK